MTRAGVEQIQQALLDVLSLLQALQSLQPSCYDSWHTGWILLSKPLWDQLMPFVVDSLPETVCYKLYRLYGTGSMITGSMVTGSMIVGSIWSCFVTVVIMHCVER